MFITYSDGFLIILQPASHIRLWHMQLLALWRVIWLAGKPASKMALNFRRPFLNSFLFSVRDILSQRILSQHLNVKKSSSLTTPKPTMRINWTEPQSSDCDGEIHRLTEIWTLVTFCKLLHSRIWSQLLDYQTLALQWCRNSIQFIPVMLHKRIGSTQLQHSQYTY